MNKKDNAISIIWSLCRRKFRCPVCYMDAVRYIPIKQYDGGKVLYLRKMLKSKRYYCFNCKKSFKDMKKLSLVDGIFLDKNTDLKERSKRYVEEICKKLVLSSNVQEKAIDILNKYNKKWGYRNVAAASIYISTLLCGERRTQTEVAYESNNNATSIREGYKDIQTVLKLEFKS